MHLLARQINVVLCCRMGAIHSIQGGLFQVLQSSCLRHMCSGRRSHVTVECNHVSIGIWRQMSRNARAPPSPFCLDNFMSCEIHSRWPRLRMQTAISSIFVASLHSIFQHNLATAVLPSRVTIYIAWRSNVSTREESSGSPVPAEVGSQATAGGAASRLQVDHRRRGQATDPLGARIQRLERLSRQTPWRDEQIWSRGALGALIPWTTFIVFWA